MISNFKDNITAPYKGVSEIFARYWRAYGGARALMVSPYLHVAVIATMALYPLWHSGDWWDIAISVSPSVLGFSLAGYAIWLALGDDSFRRLISGEDKDGEPSPFMQVNAAFVHFMLLQVLSLMVALFFKAYASGTSGVMRDIGSFIGFSIFVYSVLCVLAATFAVLRVSSWYELHVNAQEKNAGDKSKE